MKLLLLSVLNLFLIPPSLGSATLNSHLNLLVSKYHSRDYVNSSVCLQHNAFCLPHKNLTCFGTALPYTSTSIALADDSISDLDVQDNLKQWQGLRSVPRCWAVIQPLLCAVYMPKCENGSIFLPSQEMCRITRGPCRSVEVKHAWPSFLRCENKDIFPPRCWNPLREVKFNTSYKCVSPLVETDSPDNWFNEVEGCGIECQNPFFSKEDHDNVHTSILILALLCLFLNLFSAVTFVINWKIAKRYPGVLIFCINICFIVICFGWLIQFFPGIREKVVCSHDGTIRKGQPRYDGRLCWMTFLLIYVPQMAALVYFVILMYSWHVLFKQAGVPKDIVKKKVAYFHTPAWLISAVLTVLVLSMNGVDADSISGICFVGYADIHKRIIFELAPIGVAVAVGGSFLACGLCTLRVKLKDVKANLREKICLIISKIGILSTFALVFLIGTFACGVYDYLNWKAWNESLIEYVICQAVNSAKSYSSIEKLPKCRLKSKPSILGVYIRIFCFFGLIFTMSLWSLTCESLESWKRFFNRRAEQKSVALKRDQLIIVKYCQSVFQNQREINQGHISLSLSSMQDDLVGMNLDANNVSSSDISSPWAAALPQFLIRRNAVAGVVPLVPRRYSSASGMSRHISVDSLSMQISEREFVAAGRHQKRKTKKERKALLRANRNAPWFPGNLRRSDSSLQSSLMAMSSAAAAKKAGVGAKVMKHTSTSDLGIMPPCTVIFPSVPPINHRPQIQRQSINHPFTHGITDNSYHLNGRVQSVASALPGETPNQRFTPCPVLPNYSVGMVHAPLYGESSDLLFTMPFGYVGGSMYPALNGMYPGYPFNPGYISNVYNTIPYSAFNQCNTDSQQDILPMHPRVDSETDAEYLPIMMSDSEYTNAGHISCEESLMTTHRLMQENLQAQIAVAAAVAVSSAQPQSGLEPQACAKDQFLKRMDSSKVNKSTAPQTSKHASGRKSPHCQAPPPSLEASTMSLNDEDPDDDVFGETADEQKDLSATSLPKTESDNIFQKNISECFSEHELKFKKSTSSMHNIKEADAVELTSKPFHCSLHQLCESNSIKNTLTDKAVLKKTPSEGQSLMNGDTAIKNVSR